MFPSPSLLSLAQHLTRRERGSLDQRVFCFSFVLSLSLRPGNLPKKHDRPSLSVSRTIRLPLGMGNLGGMRTSEHRA
jgi:hypothetical protein